jgi:hypothetical protein
MAVKNVCSCLLTGGSVLTMRTRQEAHLRSGALAHFLGWKGGR